MAKSKKKTSHVLSRRIMIRVIPAVMAAMLLVATGLVINARLITQNLTADALETESEKDSYQIQNEVNGIMQAFDATVNGLQGGRPINSVDDVKHALEPSMKQSKMSPNGIYIGLEDGTWIDPSGWVPDADYVITDRDWYKLGKDSDIFVMGEPYVDAQTGEIVVTISRKVNVLGVDGVAAADLKLNNIVSTVSKLKPMKTGGSVLISSDSIISFFDKKLNGKTIKEANNSYINKLKKLADSGASGVQEVKSYDGNVYDCVLEKISGTNWTLISSVNKNTVFSQVTRMTVNAILISAIAIVVISLLLFFMIDFMVSKPVEGLTGNILKIADGDFRKNENNASARKKSKTEDEITQMNGSMGRFVTSMHKTLLDITGQTENLTDAAKNSALESGSLNDQASRQSESMSRISDTMNGMSDAVTELAQNATKLAQEVNELTDQGKNTSDTVNKLLSKADEGQKALAGVETEISGLSASMDEMNEAVQEVGKSAEQITSIIEMINSISSQTNLLSLNASIEAARAGEAGKGFAVVASEIGQLANNSSDATKQIADIIGEVSSKIKALENKTNENMDSIKEGSLAVASTGDTFKEIFRELDETSAIVKDMVSRVGTVNDIASSVAAIAEEQNASTEEVTATVDEITATAQKVAEASEKVNKTAKTVNDAAENIENYITKFKL